MFLKKKKTIFLLFFLLLVSNHVFPKENMFESFNEDSQKRWEFITDQVMGGVSFGKKQLLEEKNSSFIRITGFVSLENNGGFIQARRNLNKTDHKILNGIKLKLRGNNSIYYIHLRTKFTILPWQYYQGEIKASENWEEININLSDFNRSGRLLPKRIDPTKVTSIALVAFGREHKVKLDVEQINFY
jgi:hypothetical protein